MQYLYVLKLHVVLNNILVWLSDLNQISVHFFSETVANLHFIIGICMYCIHRHPTGISVCLALTQLVDHDDTGARYWLPHSNL